MLKRKSRINFTVCRLTRFYNIQHHYIPTLKFMSPKEARARALHNVNVNYAFQRIMPVLTNSRDGKLLKSKAKEDPLYGKQPHKQISRNVYYTLVIDQKNEPKHTKLLEKIRAMPIRRPLPGKYVYAINERKSCLILGGEFEYAIREGLIIDVCIYEFKDKVQMKIRKARNKFWKTKFAIKEHTIERKEQLFDGVGFTSAAVEKTHHYGKFTMTVASIFEAKDKGANAHDIEAMLLQAEKEKKEAEAEAMRKANERKQKERLKAVLAGQDEDEEDAMDDGKEYAPPIELEAEVDKLEETEEVDERLREAGDDAIEQLPSLDEIPEVIDYLEQAESFSINDVHGIHIKLDNNATRFIPGTLVRIEGNETFIPGQTFHTEEGICYVPGFTIQLEREPKFVQGMILQDENEEACFVTGSGNVRDGVLKFRPAQLEISVELGSSDEEEDKDDDDKYAKKYAQLEQEAAQPTKSRYETEKKTKRFTFFEMPKIDIEDLKPKEKYRRHERKPKPVVTSYIKSPEQARQEELEKEERAKKAEEAFQRMKVQQEKMDREKRIVQRFDNEIKEIEQMSSTLTIRSKHMISNFGAKASQMYAKLNEIDSKAYGAGGGDYQRPLPVVIPKAKKRVEIEQKPKIDYDKIHSVICEFGFSDDIVTELSKIFSEIMIFVDSFEDKDKVDIENMITADDSIIFASPCSELFKKVIKDVIFVINRTIYKHNDNLKAFFDGIDVLLKAVIKYPREDLIAELVAYQENNKTCALVVSNLLKELCLKKTSPEVMKIEALMNSPDMSNANKLELIENTQKVFKKRDEQILLTGFQHLQTKITNFKDTFYRDVQTDIKEKVFTNIDDETDVRTIEQMVTDTLRSNIRKNFQERTTVALNAILDKPESDESRQVFVKRCERLSEAYGIKKDLFKKKPDTKTEEDQKLFFRKCLLMEDLATNAQPLKECIEKMIADPKTAKFDENARKLVRAAAVLLADDEQLSVPLVNSLEIPNKYFDNDKLLCLEEYLAIRCVHTIDAHLRKELIPYRFVVCLKRGLEAVLPLEADQLILSTYTSYFLIDEQSIRFFKPIYTEKMHVDLVNRGLHANLKLKVEEHEALEKAKLPKKIVRDKKKPVEKPKIQLTTYQCLAYKLPVARMTVIFDAKIHESQEKRRKQLENAFQVRLAQRLAMIPKPEETDETEQDENQEPEEQPETKKKLTKKGKSASGSTKTTAAATPSTATTKGKKSTKSK